jgi:hypothetical protein
MPGFDGSGPMGAGSMTGGGRGRCNRRNIDEGTGFGRGRARRFRATNGVGMRKGFGRGFGMPGRYDMPSVDDISQTGINVMKAKIESMENMIEKLCRRETGIQKGDSGQGAKNV